MSTILKSLKKLEQQKENQYKGPIGGYRGPGSVSLHGVKRSWIKSAWFRRSLVAVIILGLGASSLYFYNQSQDAHQAGTNNPPPLTARNTENRPQQKPPVPRGDRDARVKTRKPPIRVQKPINRAQPGQPSETVKRTPPTQRKIQSPPVSNPSRTENPVMERRSPIPKADGAAPAQSTVRNSTDTVPAQGPKTAVPDPIRNDVKPTPSNQTQVATTRVKRKPAKAPPESYQNVATLTDGRLKVQAIVWSRIPEDRMTVINSRVLHEGDTVDGFTLLVIRSDDVLVKESGGAKWKVIFGHP